MAKFHERLTQLRKSVGMKQSEVGSALGVKQYIISSWETGRSQPNIDQIIQLAELLHTSCDYLLGRNNNITSLAYDDNNVYIDDESLLLINGIFKDLKPSQKEDYINIIISAANLTK